MIQIIVRAQQAQCRRSSEERITSGMVGKQICFDFAEAWDGMAKTAVFEGSGTKKDVILRGSMAEIPHECLTVHGGILRVGVYGTDGTIQTPTIYTDIGQIERGADPSGETSTDPTLPIWAQLQSMMGDLGSLTTEAKENLVAAINEAAKSGGTAADVKMQVAGGYIQYSTDGGKSWNNLIALSELIGPAGPKGDTGETGPAGADGKDGAAGQDGITPTIGENGNWYIGEIDTGKPSRGEAGTAGADGKDGAPGADGVGIQSVVQTTTSTEDGGMNVVTVTKTDGTSATFTVKNGRTGSAGAPGADGAAGQSAYDAAQSGGYTDTQANFYADLAAIQGLAAELAAI